MEYFTSILVAFCLITWYLSSSSLLDSKGWLAVCVAFCGLIYYQRKEVRLAKQKEQEEIVKAIEAFQRAQLEKRKMMDQGKAR